MKARSSVIKCNIERSEFCKSKRVDNNVYPETIDKKFAIVDSIYFKDTFFNFDFEIKGLVA